MARRGLSLPRPAEPALPAFASAGDAAVRSSPSDPARPSMAFSTTVWPFNVWVQPGIATGVACPSWDGWSVPAANSHGATSKLLASNAACRLLTAFRRSCLHLELKSFEPHTTASFCCCPPHGRLVNECLSSRRSSFVSQNRRSSFVSRILRAPSGKLLSSRFLAWKIHDSCHKKSHRGSTLCYRSGVETLLRTTLEDPRWRQTVYRK